MPSLTLSVTGLLRMLGRALIAVALIITILFVIWGGVSEIVFYPFSFFIQDIIDELMIAALILSLLGLIANLLTALLSGNKPQDRGKRVRYEFVAAGFMAAAILSCASYKSLLGGGYSIPISTVETEQHVYHVVLFANSEAYPEEQLLYVALRCGRFGFICKNIFQAYQRGYRERPEITSINLLHDPQTNTVSLEVNGEIVLTE